MAITTIWKSHACTVCNVSQNTFCSLVCMYAYLTSKPGADCGMWLKEHSPHHRELISRNGKVIAIWCSSQNVLRERTDNDEVVDMFVSGYETGEHFIADEAAALQFSLIYP